MKILYTIITLIMISAIPSMAQREVSFRDDFNDNKNNWFVGKEYPVEGIIANGQYQIENVNSEDSRYFWISRAVNYNSDFIIEAKFTQISGIIDNGYGIVWGAKDVSNNYQFQVTSNGYYKVAGYKDGNYVDYKAWTESDYPKPQGTPNVLKIHKKGANYNFYVNDSKVFDMPSSKVYGMWMGFILVQNMKVAIDYFEIKQDGMKINLIENAINGYKKENLGKNINTAYDEILPVIAPDGKTLFFCRKGHPENTGKDKSDDVWYSTRDDKGNWLPARNIGTPINNSDHNFVVTVTPDGNSLVVGNKYNEDGSSAGAGVSITNKSSRGWNVPNALDIENYYNNSPYSEFYLSANKKFLLMTIEREDTYGSKDIYISFERNGKFTEPLNLGPDLSTAGDEVSPFLAPDNVTLYFSSNGWPGYGSNDIFVSKRLDDTWQNWSKPQNLGPEINTGNWDAYFSLPASGEVAYLVSEDNSLGLADIFRINQPVSARPEPVVLVYGTVFNAKTKTPLGAVINYNNLSTDAELGSANSDPVSGEYKIILPYGEKYSFRATQEGFYSVSENIDISKVDKYREIKKDLYLNPVTVGETIRLNNIFFDYDKSDLKPESFPELNRLIEFLNDNSAVSIEIAGHTDNQGSDEYNANLSQARVNSVMNYVTNKGISKSRLKAKGYGESKPIADNSSEEGRQQNRRVEFKILNK